jgi:alanine racemase
MEAVVSIPQNIKVKSIFSHLAVSESADHDSFTRDQAKKFYDLAKRVEDLLGYEVIKHISNTGGIERFPEIQGNMVRLGIGLYGLQPDGTELKELQTVASLFSTVTQIHEIVGNEGIGYGLHNNEPQKRKIATIAMGYADGLSRRYGKKVGTVFLNGVEVPFVGNICMDMSMIDVTGIDCKEGDRVEIFGDQLSINKMARRGGTISYEILTGISQRVPRIYLGDN